jgi:hypothetical protein
MIKSNNKTIINEITDLLSWDYYDYVGNSTLEDSMIYGIQIYDNTYFKYIRL